MDGKVLGSSQLDPVSLPGDSREMSQCGFGRFPTVWGHQGMA